VSGHATGGSGKNLGGRSGRIAELHVIPQRALDRIRINYAVEMHRRTRVLGNFPDVQSLVTLVAARLRNVAATQWWGSIQYLDMNRFNTPNPTNEE
jgi:hypothetical protein